MTKLNILLLLLTISASGCWWGNDFSQDCNPSTCAGICQENFCVQPQQISDASDTSGDSNSDTGLGIDTMSCVMDEDCTEGFGSAAVCIEGSCSVPEITSDNCKIALGNPGAPNTLTLGAIFALSGAEEGFGGPLKDGIALAFKDLEKVKINGADLAILICDNKSTLEGSVASAKHLAEVVKVPAIIGPEFSDHIIPVLEVAKPNETVIVTIATAALIGSLDDDDLVWRTSPSDIFQSEAIAKLLGATKEALVAESKPSSKILVLTAGDGVYTGGLRDGLNANLTSVGITPNEVTFLNYPTEALGEWVTQNSAALNSPDIVVIFGFADAWALSNTINDSATSKPIFIYADGAKNQTAAVANQALTHRVLGTVPQTVGDSSYAPYSGFRTRFLSAGFQNPEAPFLPHVFDAVYTVALAAGANGFTGPDIAEGMKRLSKGQGVSPTRAGFEQAAGILRQGDNTTVDYEGASGKVDFDTNGDASRAPITLWCFDGTKLFDNESDTLLLDANNVFSFIPSEIFGMGGCLESFLEP